MQISAEELCELLGGTLEGDPKAIITKPAKIEEARADEVSFIGNPKYEQYANTTQAGVLVVNHTFSQPSASKATLIRVDDPYQSITKILEIFSKNGHNGHNGNARNGVERKGGVAASAQLGEDVYVGAYSVVGENVKLGNNVKIYPNSYIGDNTEIGDNTIIYSGVHVYHDTIIGQSCIVHSGAIIGSDGFGFAPDKQKGTFNKIPQTGNVIIGNKVEIGANTCVDRGTMGSTIIRDGVKIDNLIQIAHNVEIEENTVIAAQTGISGSTKIGKNCMIGGQVGFVGHLVIGDGTRVNAQSGVSKSVPEPKQNLGGAPAFDFRKHQKSQVIFRNLPELEARVRELEERLRQLDK